MNNHSIKIHGPDNFESMRKAGQLASDVLDYITPYVKPEVTTGYLNDLAHDYILSNNAIPAPLNYKGFPKSTCISVNHVVCHGIPGDKKLQSGDILNIDVTVILDGWYGDTSRMFFAGEPSVKAKRLCDVTYKCLMAGIEVSKPGATLGDIGYAIQTLAEKERFSVVRRFYRSWSRPGVSLPTIRIALWKSWRRDKVRARNDIYNRANDKCWRVRD